MFVIVRAAEVKTNFEEFCETFSFIISVFKDSQATPVSEVLLYSKILKPLQ
jgi:hypothetical protein